MVFETLTVLTAISGIYGATAKRKGEYGKAGFMDEASRHSLITAKKSIELNNYEATKTKFGTYEEAGRRIADITKVAGETRETAKTEASASGALVESGTSRENLRVMAQDELQAKLGVALGAKRNIDTIIRETKMNNNMIWENAKYESNMYKAKADATRKSAENMFKADILNTAAQTAMMGSKIPGSPSSPNLDQSASLANSPLNQTGSSFNTWDKTKMYGSNILRNMKNKRFDPSQRFSSIWARNP